MPQPEHKEHRYFVIIGERECIRTSELSRASDWNQLTGGDALPVPSGLRATCLRREESTTLDVKN